jgi:DNA segregation ATPase FtsK/SpoIIIE-like protein
VHAAFISDGEAHRVVEHLKARDEPLTRRLSARRGENAEMRIPLARAMA